MVWTIFVIGGSGILLKKMVDHYMSGAQAAILFLSLLGVIVIVFIARSQWNRWEPAKNAPATGSSDSKQNIEASVPHFAVRSSWTQDMEGGTQIWIDRDPELIHIQKAMVVYFTNLRSTPLMVYASTLEQQTPQGEWVSVGQTLFGEDHVFLGVDPKDVVKTTYKTFESVSQNRNIAPNETVFGWVFMRKRPSGDLRLSVTYADGTVRSEPIKNMGGGEGFPDIPKPVSTKERFDFSKHQIIK